MKLRSFASYSVLALFALGSACSSSNNDNNTGADTSVDEDTGTTEETGGDDSSTTEDTSKPDTSTGSDTAVEDTGTSETATDAPADVVTTCTEAGAVETGDCGKCGKHARLCDSTGVWLSWGACTGESGVCSIGETRTTNCGKCGKRSETCSATCAWDPGACTGEGLCNAGDMEIQYGACSNPKYVKTRTCSSTCAWGDWTGCVPPKGWVDIAASPLSARYQHTAVWTGTEMIVWGGYSGYSDGAAYNLSTDTWRTLPAVTSTISGFYGRYLHTAVWTGSKMIVWGGYGSGYRNDGATYDPAGGTGTWASIATAPITTRQAHTAVWTGTEMIVWGGYNGSYLADGAAYNPVSNTWRTIAAPPSGFYGRYYHQAVWAGGKMIVFGGYGSSCSSYYCGDAAAYDPSANTWTPLTPPSSDLDGRYYHIGLATGTTSSPTATFWGGYGSSVSSSYYRNTGATFDPAGTGTWKAITPPSDAVFPNSRRYLGVGWWTGDTLFVWGGYSGTYPTNGASYDPATSTWRGMSDSNAPVGRVNATAVWTGAEAIVWGGSTSTSSSISYARNDGKIYRP